MPAPPVPGPPSADIARWVVGDVLARQAADRGGSAYLQPTDGPPVTFAEMDERATRVASALIRAGVTPGERVLVLLGNSPDFVAIWCGIARAGAVFVPVNTAFRGAFLEHVVTNTGARIAVAERDLVPILAASEPGMPSLQTVFVRGDGPRDAPFARIRARPFADLLASPDRPAFPPVSVHDVGAILFTSGTSGPSKGPLLPHGHLHLNPHVYIEQLRLTSDDVLYTCLPLFHANALLLGAYAALILGCRLVLARRFSAGGWLHDIRDHGVTATNLLGTMLDFITRQPGSDRDRDHACRTIAAVPLVAPLGQAFERRFATKLVGLYGTTEINCPFYMPVSEPIRPGSCGRLMADWFEVRVADPATDAERPDGEVGELLVRPRVPGTFMLGYNGMPEETVAAFRNLWFHTGDAFRRDSDGYYAFVDRLRDYIRRRGENVSSFEVERVLLAMPGVEDAAVVGVPSGIEDGEQEIKACLVLDPGIATAPAEIVAFCADRMPGFAVPRFVEILEALPRTATEKVRKEVLRAKGVTGAWDREGAGVVRPVPPS